MRALRRGRDPRHARGMEIGGFLSALRRGRGPPALILLFGLFFHPVVNLLALGPSAAERALLADLGALICSPAGAAEGAPVPPQPHHDPDSLLCGFACTLAACSAASPPAVAAAPLFPSATVLSLATPSRATVRGLAIHPSDIGSRAPPVLA